jgi:hypothetical protein
LKFVWLLYLVSLHLSAILMEFMKSAIIKIIILGFIAIPALFLLFPKAQAAVQECICSCKFRGVALREHDCRVDPEDSKEIAATCIAYWAEAAPGVDISEDTLETYGTKEESCKEAECEDIGDCLCRDRSKAAGVTRPDCEDICYTRTGYDADNWTKTGSSCEKPEEGPTTYECKCINTHTSDIEAANDEEAQTKCKEKCTAQGSEMMSVTKKAGEGGEGPLPPAPPVKLESPIAIKTPLGLVNAIISTVLGVVGILSVVFIVWGGFGYIMAGGSEERVQMAKRTITYAIIGLVFAIGAYIIMNTIIKAIAK